MTDDRLALQGRRIKEFRENLGQTAASIAHELRLASPQSIYDLENGKRDLKAWEAIKLAALFGVAPEVIAGLDSPSSDRVCWRGESNPQAENLLRTRLDRFILLQKLAGRQLDSRPPIYKVEANVSFERVDEIAGEVVGLLNLGEYPARSLAEALMKRWSVVIFHLPLDRVSGACLRTEETCGILLNSKEAWWRRNFSLGHEVFHLLVEPAQAFLPEREEKLANVFASRLLIPSDSVLSEYRRLESEHGAVSYFQLMRLAREYMVSTDTLLWRIHNLGVLKKETVERFLSDPALQELDRLVHGEARRDEPELPRDLVLSAYEVYLNGKISIGKLAEYLETTVGRLKKVLPEYGIVPFSPAYETTLGSS